MHEPADQVRAASGGRSLRERLKANRFVLFLFRVRTLWSERRSVRRRPGAGLRYLRSGREFSTFTFELENRDELAAFIAEMLGADVTEAIALIDELEGDEELRAMLAARLEGRPNRYDSPRYAKRCGYYAMVRLMRPRSVVETGTHDGLGSSVLARAMQRNAEETGSPPGVVLTFDVNPDAGWLIPPPLEPLVRRHTGMTRDTLGPTLALSPPVELMIHDSLRTSENERFEFEMVIKHAVGGRLVLICDDVETTQELEKICTDRGGSFGVFRERPKDHFYRGDAMGLAVLDLGLGDGDSA
jgi:hypothetical protein